MATTKKTPKNPELTKSIAKEKAQKNGPTFKLSLNEEQKEGKRIALENHVTVFIGSAGSGKAQPLYSKIKTKNGEVLMGELKIGDYVLTPKGTETKVLGIFPQGKEDVYRVTFDDGSYTDCSLNHLWNVKELRKRNVDKFNTKSLKEIQKEIQKGKRFKIPVTNAIEFEEKKLEIHPYLLGIIISEGHINNNHLQVSISDEFVINKIKQLLPETDELKQKSNFDFSIQNKNKINGYANHIKCLNSKKEFNSKKEYLDYENIKQTEYKNRIKKGLIRVSKHDSPYSNTKKSLENLNLYGKKSYDKFIPEIYKNSSISQRIELLQGLFDGDGYVSKNGKVIEYYTSSSRLKDDIVEIINSLGGVCKIKQYYPKYTYKGEKKVSEHLSYTIKVNILGLNLFSLPRKAIRVTQREKYLPCRIIEKIEYIGNYDTQCIYVEDEEHLYLTDNYIVTHNTLLAVQVACDLFFKKEVEKIVIARPLVTAGEETGFLPGDLKEKTDPYLQPIYDNMYQLLGKQTIDKLVAEGMIEIIPFAYMRGRTFTNACVILDEAQNCTDSQLEMALGRLGIGSKMLICGDVAQIDLKTKKHSGLAFTKKIELEVEGFKVVTLKQNHRHPIVADILKVYENYKD